MSGKRTIRVVLPDAGPLISLASADSLDLLLSFRESVRIALTDVVHFEATHRSEDLPDAQAIVQFLEANPDRIEIIPTTVGSLALAEVRRKQQAGMPASLPRDIGELSITNFVIQAVRPRKPAPYRFAAVEAVD